MIPTRRDVAGMTFAAVAMAPGVARAQAGAPIIIADGGAGTAPAYELAVRDGADFLGADLVATQDGALLVRRDHEISESTDVAAHPEFAARRGVKAVNGQSVEGWFTEDFTLAELKTLSCRDPNQKPGRSFGGKWPILTFQEVMDLARAGSVKTARVIGVCATMTRPAHFASLGLQLETRLADAVRAGGYNSPAAAMMARSSEVGALNAFGGLCRIRRVLMTRADTGPADQPEARFDPLITDEALTAVRAFAEAISLGPARLLDLSSKAPAPTDLVARAHSAGLAVHADARAPTLPPAGARLGDIRVLMTALFAAGVDGLSCEDPGLAVKARRDARDELRRRPER